MGNYKQSKMYRESFLRFRRENDSAEKPKECFDTLSMNGKFPSISTAPPFVLRFSKDEREVFQQNQKEACPLKFSQKSKVKTSEVLRFCEFTSTI
jgi:hypothetical protein